jgi:hypothetical protein
VGSTNGMHIQLGTVECTLQSNSMFAGTVDSTGRPQAMCCHSTSAHDPMGAGVQGGCRGCSNVDATQHTASEQHKAKGRERLLQGKGQELPQYTDQAIRM